MMCAWPPQRKARPNHRTQGPEPSSEIMGQALQRPMLATPLFIMLFLSFLFLSLLSHCTPLHYSSLSSHLLVSTQCRDHKPIFFTNIVLKRLCVYLTCITCIYMEINIIILTVVAVTNLFHSPCVQYLCDSP